MALSTYIELQAAIQAEVTNTESAFVTAIPDLIKRAESKINRKTRLREAEQLAFLDYTAAATDRYLALPSKSDAGQYVELLNLRHKVATAADSTYQPTQYVEPSRITDYYETQSDNGKLYYTLRDQIEFNRNVSTDHTIMMHFIKAWDLATDSTNWLLTNYPDAYLYGALAETALFWKEDQRVVLWKALFDQALDELNELSQRGRDDAVLDTSELACMSGHGRFNILTG